MTSQKSAKNMQIKAVFERSLKFSKNNSKRCLRSFVSNTEQRLRVITFYAARILWHVRYTKRLAKHKTVQHHTVWMITFQLESAKVTRDMSSPGKLQLLLYRNRNRLYPSAPAVCFAPQRVARVWVNLKTFRKIAPSVCTVDKRCSFRWGPSISAAVECYSVRTNCWLTNLFTNLS